MENADFDKEALEDPESWLYEVEDDLFELTGKGDVVTGDTGATGTNTGATDTDTGACGNGRAQERSSRLGPPACRLPAGPQLACLRSPELCAMQPACLRARGIAGRWV